MTATASRSVRRDWLKRQVQAGRAVLVGAYSYSEHAGQDSGPVADRAVVYRDDGDPMVEGVCNLRASDFRGSAGRAWRQTDGTITLYVHSNRTFDLRVS